MIKGFKELEKQRPHVEVKIGGLCPTGCKEKWIYHESPSGNKCTNSIDGECPYVTQKGTFWINNKKQNILCPNARKEKENCVTRPFQLGYFDIPEQYRIALGLPDRPVELPGIVFMSKHDFSADIREPLSVLFEYPVMDYYLAWWKKTALVCKGDGEIAHWYPASPEHDHYNKEWGCAYEECKYFNKNGGHCKETMELYFRIPNAPGFPAMWRFMTRSRKVIQYMLQEIKQLHTMLNGRVSFVPLKLSLEPEKGRPIVGGKRLTTEVFRLHLRTDFTMMDVIGHVKTREHFLIGDGSKLLTESTPEHLDPEPPVEATATDVEPETAQKTAEKPKQEKPASQPTEKKKAPEAKKESPATNDEYEAQHMKEQAGKLEDMLIEQLNKGKTIQEIRKVANDGVIEFKKSYPGYAPERLKKAYYNKKQALAGAAPAEEATPAGAPPEEPPDPEPPADVQKKASGDSGSILEKVKGYMNQKPPVFSENQALDMFGHNSIEDFSADELAQLLEFIEDGLKQV